MESYNDKTEGAFIQMKESTIIWNFENTDFDHGNI